MNTREKVDHAGGGGKLRKKRRNKMSEEAVSLPFMCSPLHFSSLRRYHSHIRGMRMDRIQTLSLSFTHTQKKDKLLVKCDKSARTYKCYCQSQKSAKVKNIRPARGMTNVAVNRPANV